MNHDLRKYCAVDEKASVKEVSMGELRNGCTGWNRCFVGLRFGLHQDLASGRGPALARGAGRRCLS